MEVEPAFVTEKVTPEPSLEDEWAPDLVWSPCLLLIPMKEFLSLVLLLPCLRFFLSYVYSIFFIVIKYIQHTIDHHNHFEVCSPVQ